jgi:hypothetical protein
VDRANETAVRAPKTAFAKFVVTPRDIGSEVVRAGHMAELEEERHALLLAAKMVLKRAEAGVIKLDAVSEYALKAAVAISG